jgi:hypothetical protein
MDKEKQMKNAKKLVGKKESEYLKNWHKEKVRV